MNMCAVFAEMDRHDKALSFAKQAITVVYEELSSLKIGKKNGNLQEKYFIVAIAHFNLGTEEEYFIALNNALKSYLKAVKVLKKHCGDEIELRKRIFESIKRVRLALNPRPTTPLTYKSNIVDRKLGRAFTPNEETGKRLKNSKSFREKWDSNSKQVISSRTVIKFSRQKKLEFKPSASVRRISMISKEKLKEKCENIENEVFSDKDAENLKTFYIKNDGILENTIKIQAFFRGYTCRKKFPLARKSHLVCLRRWKLINGIATLVTITRRNEMIMIQAETTEKMLISEFPISLTYAEIYSMVLIINDKIVLIPINPQKKLIYTGSLTSGHSVIYFLTNNLLEIQVKTENSLLSTQIQLPNIYNKSTIRYIIDNIQPFIAIKNDKIVILACNTLISKGYLILEKAPVLVEVFLNPSEVEYIIKNSKYCISPIPDSDKIPLILFVTLKETQFATRSIEKIKQISKEKMLLNNNFEYYLAVYCIGEKKSWYFFYATCENAPMVTGISYLEKEIKNIFKVRSVEKNIKHITSRILIVNNMLKFENISEKIDCNLIPEKIIVKIQSIFRGNRSRDMLKLQKSKPLIISLTKLKNNKEFQISLFSINKSVLIQIKTSETSKCFYHFVQDPLHYVTKFYRFSNVKLLIDTIGLDKLPKITKILNGQQQDFCESFCDPNESLPIFQLRTREKLLIMCSQSLHKIVVIKVYDYDLHKVLCKRFSVADVLEITGKYDLEALLSMVRCTNDLISTSEMKVLRSATIILNEGKVIYRTCIKILGVLYQVVVALNSELLKFTYKRGSFMGGSLDFEISIDSACEKSGFSKSFLIPMVNFMIKNLLFLKDDEIVIDTSTGAINIDQVIRRLQATFRSYIQRKRLYKLTHMKLLLKIKKSMENAIYTVILFEKFDCLLLCAVKGFEVYKKYISKTMEISLERIVKENMHDLFIMNNLEIHAKDVTIVSKDLQKTFITESKIAREVIWQGQAEINGQKADLALVALEKSEIVECSLNGKQVFFEIDSNFLPHDESLSAHLDLTKTGELLLKVKQKKLIFFQKKTISSQETLIQVLQKHDSYLLLCYLIKPKRYLIKSLDLNTNISTAISKAKIHSYRENYTILLPKLLSD